MQASGGYSNHGSGDFKGVFTAVDLLTYKTENFFLKYSLASTINSGRVKITVIDPNNSTHDASIRFTTAGFQLGVNGGYNLIRSLPNSVLLSLGAFARYQSASNGSDGYSLYGPAITGQPTILVGYDNRSAQHTFTVAQSLRYN